MQTLITVSSETQSELLMIEFQGEFEHNHEDSFEGLDLGTLTERPGGTYELTVGNHLLRGKGLCLTFR